MTTMRRFVVVLGCLLVALVSANETPPEEPERQQPPPRVLPKKHEHQTDHAAIEEELRGENVESFTCTISGASGQDQCDAATDDDGSKCVWCVLNNFGFCVSGTQAAQFEQVIPTIDCDDQNNDDDKAPADDDKEPATDDATFSCLESKDEASCGDKCVWCNTKGGFGVCLTPEQADDASDSYWFDCPSDEGDDDDDEEAEDRYYPDEEQGEEDDEYGDDSREEGGASQEDEYEDEEEMEDYVEGEDDYEDEEGEDYDDEEEGEEGDPDMHEFIVDTSCVLSGMLLDPADEEATSEAACFQARDATGNPCEWCAVAGSPFRLCLSEPQAQVAEYVGAVCTGSDESFEPEDFDDSCIAHMHGDRNLSKEGCWQHQDLDGNGCEWCNIMGVELCLGGVQAELVEHWGATCVMDDAEHAMAQAAIQQHLEFVRAQKDAELAQRVIKKQAEQIQQMGEVNPERPHELDEEEEEEIDLQTLWLTSDPSCMVTTLRTSTGDDQELACAQTQDKDGHPCNWCQMGTSFYMCLNEEQADIAEYMGIECETISADTQDILKEHAQRAEDYQDSDEDDTRMDDLQDFDPNCIMAMKDGPDQSTCVNTKDQDGQACEWCSWNQFSLCLAAEQAQMVEPFGAHCDQVTPRKPSAELPKSAILTELTSRIDTSCLIDAGQANDPDKCTAAKDAVTGKPCEWCSLGSLGVNACLSVEQAEVARPLGVTCKEGAEPIDDAILQDVPRDFWSCLSQSQSIDQCDDTCTWCDLKESPTGAGLCLSDAVADAIITYWPDGMLDCTEPTPVAEEQMEDEGEGEEETDAEDDQGDDDDEYDDDRAESEEGEGEGFDEETS